MNRASAMNAALVPFALLSGLYFSFGLIRCVRASQAIHVLKAEDFRGKKAASTGSAAAGAESTLNRIARDAGVRRLVSVAATLRNGAVETTIEWESDLRSSLTYLSQLRAVGMAAAIPVLTMASMDQQPGQVRGRATLRSGAPDVTPGTNRTDVRDVFFPLWKNEFRFAAMASDNLRRQDEQRRKDQERADAERKAQDAAQKLDNRRHAIESRYALTGIVTDNRGALAFITADRQRSLLVRTGDRLDDARVANIDDKNGTMTLDADGAFTVLLRLGAGEHP